MLRRFAESLGIAVGKDKHAMIALDYSELASRIAWQTCVSRRIDVTSANTLSNLVIRNDHDNLAATFPAVRGGTALGVPFARRPDSISARVARPLLTSNSTICA